MAKNIQLQTKLNEPSQAQLDLPFYNLLPKDKIGILKWRIYCLARCASDAEFRRDIEEMCRQDIAFFAVTSANSFASCPGVFHVVSNLE